MEDPLLATSTGRSCFYFYFILAYCCSPTRFFIAIRICPPTLSGVRVWPRLSQVGTLVSNLKGFWSRFSSFPLLLCWLTFRREDEEVLSKTRDSTSLFLSFFLSFLIYRPRRFPLPLPSRTPLHSHYSSKLSRNWLTLFYLLTYLHCVVESSRSKKKENRAKPRFEGKFGGRLQSVLLLLKSSPILLCGYTIDPS